MPANKLTKAQKQEKIKARVGASKGGRPSIFSDEIAKRICDGIRAGKSLIAVCEEPGMPTRLTVSHWLDDPEKDSFYTEYTRARLSQADYMDDRIKEVADNSTPHSAPADRVKLTAYQWRAERLMPKRYGVRVHKEVTGADGGPVKLNVSNLSDDELENLERILAKSTGRSTEGGEGGAE